MFGDYEPRNFDRGFQGTVTVATALQLSLNVPAVALLDRIAALREKHRAIQDEVEAMVINVDRKSRSINLSIKAKDQAEQNEAMQKFQSESSASSGTTNLGALLKAKLGNTQQ